MGKIPIQVADYDDPNYLIIEEWLKTNDFQTQFNSEGCLFKTCHENLDYAKCDLLSHNIKFLEDEAEKSYYLINSEIIAHFNKNID